jgi:hypothetical protein
MQFVSFLLCLPDQQNALVLGVNVHDSGSTIRAAYTSKMNVLLKQQEDGSNKKLEEGISRLKQAYQMLMLG